MLGHRIRVNRLTIKFLSSRKSIAQNSLVVVGQIGHCGRGGDGRWVRTYSLPSPTAPEAAQPLRPPI